MRYIILTLIFTLLAICPLKGLTAVAIAEEATEPVVKNLIVDKENKSIFYELSEPATVRIRVGSKSGPLHKTLIDWQSQEKGQHTIQWDGMDTSKTFNILDNKNFTFSFNYYLPGKDEKMTITEVESNLIVSDYFIGKVPKYRHISQIHKNHKKEYCKDLEILFKLPNNIITTKKLSLTQISTDEKRQRGTDISNGNPRQSASSNLRPSVQKKTEEGFAKIKGITPITIELPDADKLWFRQERFSINIFIDDVFVKGEAQGYAPYTWNFNPKGINKGKHLITVNLKGFNDHIAVGSLAVYIEPKGDAE